MTIGRVSRWRKVGLLSWRWCIEFKLEDFWIGFFWKRSGTFFDLWICAVPCVPLHVQWIKELS